MRPGATQVISTRGNVLARGSIDGALVHDKISGLVVAAAEAALGGDGTPSIRQYANLTAVEPGIGGSPEDEVDGAFDVAFCVRLGALLRVEGV